MTGHDYARTLRYLIVCALIRFYQRYLSPRTPVCPQVPSCSDYALQHGLRAVYARNVLWETLPKPPGTRPECTSVIFRRLR